VSTQTLVNRPSVSANSWTMFIASSATGRESRQRQFCRASEAGQGVHGSAAMRGAPKDLTSADGAPSHIRAGVPQLESLFTRDHAFAGGTAAVRQFEQRWPRGST
jgi:hypothetical protein